MRWLDKWFIELNPSNWDKANNGKNDELMTLFRSWTIVLLLPFFHGGCMLAHSPEWLLNCIQVQNAVEFLKMICALDEKENLTDLGMLYIYFCGWIKFFIIGLAILFVIMDLKFVGSTFFFPGRKIPLNASSWSKTREDAYYGCCVSLLWSCSYGGVRIEC